jgi:hypothetical protein
MNLPEDTEKFLWPDNARELVKTFDVERPRSSAFKKNLRVPADGIIVDRFKKKTMDKYMMSIS